MTIPYSVRIIEESAFEGCAVLAELEIPESVTEIGKKAFEGCACAVTYKGKKYASGKYEGLYKTGKQ